MAKNRKGMNKFQKAIHRPGDHRTRGDDIGYLLELASSHDPNDRVEAAENLCPCHVRRRIDEVWDALYRMMEDPDVRVRRAAWHTLEDGGCPTDPALDPIFERTLANETDTQVRRFAEMFAHIHQARKEVEFQRIMRTEFQQRGRCDFCGAENSLIKRDFETEIRAANGTDRLAWICEQCSG